MKTLAILLGEHPCTVNVLFGPMTVHYREVLLYVVKAIEEAAASSIGITPPSRSQSQTFCPEINRMSHEQKMLRLRIDNTQDAEILSLHLKAMH